MRLFELLGEIDYELLSGSMDIDITGLFYDSRKVIRDSVFVCITGANSDGHSYIGKAAELGAAAVVVTKEVDPSLTKGLTVVRVKDDREALASMSAAWFSHPAAELVTIGITGTKGKTTTSYMVYDILKRAGRKPGLIGTIETIIGDERIASSNTTPESYLVQEYFRRMVDSGCDCVVMEVSSQGLMQKRVGGFVFDIGVFTNMEPDHIGPNEHASFEEYMACKGLLFKQCKLGLANVDDEHMETVLKDHSCSLKTFGLSEGADYRAVNVNLKNSGGSLGISYEFMGEKESFPVHVNIPGQFTVYNSLTAVVIARILDIEPEAICNALLHTAVRGRVEPVSVSDSYTVMVDYAHNAMALESLLTTMKDYNPKRLVCMFGCGGNRSKDRRFEMGEVSSRLADLTVVTSDNPRFEKPEDIISDILVGVKRGDGEYVVVPDRREAIYYVLSHANAGDVIIIAGKGHEDYQEIEGVKYHMDDREMILEAAERIKSERA